MVVLQRVMQLPSPLEPGGQRLHVLNTEQIDALVPEATGLPRDGLRDVANQVVPGEELERKLRYVIDLQVATVVQGIARCSSDEILVIASLKRDRLNVQGQGVRGEPEVERSPVSLLRFEPGAVGPHTDRRVRAECADLNVP